ncbi:MAG TPA: DUF2325 domain-containing protein, partial [Thauera sp.]|nr:DUF2325 domain-containing protein [Thauera sp.]
QARCSDLLTRQAGEIQAQQAEIMRLRAEVIRRDTQIALLRDERAELERTIPGLPTRLTLAKKVRVLMERIQDLMRERHACRARLEEDRPLRLEQATMLSRLDDRSVLCLGRDASAARFMMRLVEMAGGRFTHDPADGAEDLARIEQSMRAADLVICQAGCISQNAYWRVRDHCRRTGKPCLLVERPEAISPVQR